MKKAYIAPETVTIQKDTAIEGNPDEVGAKGDLWGSGDDDLW